MTVLHLDVLELIVALVHGEDLVAAALVSRDFLAAALPAIYADIEYTAHHAKRAHTITSPFATLVAHSHLPVHVRRIAVHAAPNFPPSAHRVHPVFLEDLTHALRNATNLRAFVCTVNILPPLLPSLVDRHALHHIRLVASLASRQVAVLRNTSRLHSLALDYPSWHVIDVLPNWAASMQRTLAHLTLYMSQDLDASSLNATLAHLNRLRGLHVIACPRITHSAVLRALFHTPDLLELSLTLFPSQETTLPALNFPNPPLTHLSIDVRASYPIIRPFIALIVSRLSPRNALAICGGWIGEIRSSAESTNPLDPAGSNGPTPAHPHGWGNVQHEDPPLLTVPHLHNSQVHPSLNQGPPAQANQPPLPNVFGFPFDFPLVDPNGNGNGGDPAPPDPPGPDFNPTLGLPLLVTSLPSTLTTLHLPLLSYTALKEIVDRCDAIQVLGIVIRTPFSFPAPVKPSKAVGRTRSKHTAGGVRAEIIQLANILSRARALRELIIDTCSIGIAESNTESEAEGPHGPSRGTALLTPLSVRKLMRESPLLRRIVGEGRVWESPTPTPTLPVPFPNCLPIDLTLAKARFSLGASSHHAYGPHSFGSDDGQMYSENDHWFWLRGSASGGKVYRAHGNMGFLSL